MNIHTIKTTVFRYTAETRETIIVDTHQNCPGEEIIMTTHNMFFLYAETLKKITAEIFSLPSEMHVYH